MLAGLSDGNSASTPLAPLVNILEESCHFNPPHPRSDRQTNAGGSVLPALFAGAGDRAALRFLEYFTVNSFDHFFNRIQPVMRGADFANSGTRPR